ncbi:RadC family protein [Neofamilia massiliensis]|uniref:RadC family protein n=1 Tax=Neofamilia massiliensis TaxID=1673724 RepID=UPI0006BB59DE|nr:DNA repair protein RadC [Neofamilia massiliensis]
MYKNKIKDMPEDMRPQEKLLLHGPKYLSNAELIALIIRTGSKDKSSIEISQELIDKGKSLANTHDEYFGLKFLVNASVEDLMEVSGIGHSKACMVQAAIELGRRTFRDSAFTKEKINETHILPNLVMNDMRYLTEEEFRIAILNTKKELEYLELISIGSVDKTIVEPRDVFQKAIRRNAHTIILLHNHPSGDPRPSIQDINITERLKSAGKLIGIEVIDHVIIGDGVYYSFLEEGIF